MPLIPTNYSGSVTNGTIPRGLTYPPSQKITSTASYNAAAANLNLKGGGNMTTRMYGIRKRDNSCRSRFAIRSLRLKGFYWAAMKNRQGCPSSSSHGRNRCSPA